MNDQLIFTFSEQRLGRKFLWDKHIVAGSGFLSI